MGSISAAEEAAAPGGEKTAATAEDADAPGGERKDATAEEAAAPGGEKKDATAEEAAAPGGEKKDVTAKEAAAAESATEEEAAAEEAADAAAGAESPKKDDAENAGGLACLMCTDVLNDGQPVTALECGHTFHVHCIGRWANKNGGGVSMRICPFKCKMETVDVDDDVQSALTQALGAGDAL